MKRAIIIHCWDGNPDYCWYPSVKKGLEESGFVVDVPLMPNPRAPERDAWVSKLAEVVGVPDKDTYLISHSMGGPTILRYFEELYKDQQFGGVVMVAGYTDNLGFKEIDSFFKKPFDWNKIRLGSKDWVLIHSDDDPYVSLEQGEILKEKLEAELLIFSGSGHFSGGDNCNELPIVVEKVMKMAKSD